MNPPPTDTDTVRGRDPAARAIDAGDSAPVIALPRRSSWPLPGPGGGPLGAAVVLVALALAASPVAVGYYNFSVWGPLTLAAMVLLIVVAWAGRSDLDRRTLWACGGIGALLALSGASILWAQSKESAWTDTNRLALYVTIFLIALLAVRDGRTARALVLILGLAALVTGLVLPLEFIFGGGRSAFLERRLNDPIGYINGTAGMLVMGVWVWLACAQYAPTRRLRALALSGATLIAATVVLTQSRAVIPATVLSAVIVLACTPGRARRAINLVVLAACVGISLHWTLRVYSQTSPSALPSQGLIRDAAIAIILVAALAGLGSLLIDKLADGLEPTRRAVLSNRVGVGLLAAIAIALVGGVAVKHSWISHEWQTFKADRVNQSATVRLVDASGFRHDLWRIALKEFGEHPWGGLGAGNYDAEYYRLRRNPTYVLQPHSIELQMLAELGIGGLLALVAFCGAVFWAGFARRGTLAAQDPFLRIGALGVFSAWLIDTSVDWLYDIPGLTGMAMIAAALLLLPNPTPPAHASRSLADPTPPGRSRRSQVALLGGLGVLAILAASVGRQYVATRYASSGEAEVAGQPRQALGDLRTASKLDPYSLTTLYAIASAYARLDEYTQARAALQLAEQREPSNYVPPALLGDLAVRRGLLRVAVSDYERAARLNPRDPGVSASLQSTEAALRQ